MKKIGQGKYQKAYLKNGLVYKYARIGDDFRNKSLLIKRYFNDLKKIGIPVPSFLRVKYQRPFLITICEYCGIPLERFLLRANRNLVFKIYSEIVRLGLLAFKSHIAFHPKINQFTYRNGKIYFTDFYPSRTTKDFLSYNEEKRNSLGLLFYSLAQKVLTPTNELIGLRGDLKEEILDMCKIIIVKNQKLKIFRGDIEQCLKHPKNKKLFRINVHLWTKNLYEYDQKVAKKILT